VIYAIEAFQFDAGTTLTPKVLAAAFAVVDLIQKELGTSCETVVGKTGEPHA
jgi:hypothetical protein